MTEIKEVLKGVFVFIIAGLFFYFAWDNIFSGTLNYMSDVDARIGALGWGSWILMFLTTCFIYPLYAIINGSKGGKETKPLEIFKAIGIWVLAMGLVVLVFLISTPMIDTLSDTEIEYKVSNFETGETTQGSNADILDEFSQVSWLIILFFEIASITIPFYFIIKGFGKEVKLGG